MGHPGVEIAPDALVGMISVEPEESDGLLPTRSDHLAARVEQANVAVRAGSNHVPKEGGSVLRPELTTAGPDERLVRLHGVDPRSVTVLDTTSEDDGGAPPKAPDLDDAALHYVSCETVEQHSRVTGEPPSDRRHILELVRPIGMFPRQERESSWPAPSRPRRDR